ncbi:MAG: hypothetical protein ABIJ41_04065 [Candidatus Omnitrophota bacterium]
MKPQAVIIILLLITGGFVLSGCETMKGLKQDIKNTWNNASTASDKFQEKWW